MRIRDALRFLRYVNEAAGNTEGGKKNVKKVIKELEGIANNPKKSDISVAQKDKIEAAIEGSDSAKSNVNDWLARCGISETSELYEKLEYICSKSRALTKALVGALERRFKKKDAIDFTEAFQNSFTTPVDVLGLCASKLGDNRELAKKLYYTTWSDGGINHGAGEAVLAMLCKGAKTEVGVGDISIDGYPIEIKASQKSASSSAGRLSNGRDLKDVRAVRSGIFKLVDTFYKEINTNEEVLKYGEIPAKNLKDISIKVKYTSSATESSHRIDKVILEGINEWAKHYSVDELVLENVIKEAVINLFKAIWGNFFLEDNERNEVAKIIDTHLVKRKMSEMLDELSVISTEESNITTFGYELLALYTLRYIKKEGLLILVGKNDSIRGTYLGENILSQYKGIGEALNFSKELMGSKLVFAWPELNKNANQKVAGGIYLKP